MNNPVEFGIEFLNWFTERTELSSTTLFALCFDNYVQSGIGWALSGLSGEQIQKIEDEWSLIFPLECHLFLQNLHCVDRP